MLSKFRFTVYLSALLLALFVVPVQGEMFQLPGVVPPSACRDGGVLSTDQFVSTGYSNVRTANPNDEIVAGAWVVANGIVPDMSILLPPNCPVAPGLGNIDDNMPMNLMAVRIVPTIGSASEADIREIKLVWDVNVNGLWDPLLDLVMQVKDGSGLDSQDGIVFFNGPQNPLAIMTHRGGAGVPCTVNSGDVAVIPGFGIGPAAGTNSRGGTDGCYMPLLAIAVIGDNPTTGTQFGLQLEALAGDIPGTAGLSSFTFSSGFSSSRNPQASNVRLHMVGGSPSSHTPLEHISNASANPESNVATIQFSGGQLGEGLLTRFRDHEINPGTREAIAMAVALCDGAFLASANAAILPPIAGAPPTIAGGLTSLPCIGSAGTDGFATGVNGATLIFRGPLARYMSTVRMYTDECSLLGGGALGLGLCAAIGGGVVAAPTTASDTGGGDGLLFQPGELSDAAIPIFNEQTGEAIVQFGGRQEQVLFTGNGNVVGHGSDPACGGPAPIAGCGTTPAAGTTPLILMWTVDVDQNAPGGIVDVVLGLQSFDDTALNNATGPGAPLNPCVIFATSAPALKIDQVFGAPAPGPGSCASNFLNIGPENYSFSVKGPEHPSTPSNLAAFDTNSSCFLDDPEFFGMIDGWVNAQIGDSLFFAGVDAWVGQENVCNIVGGNSLAALSLDSVLLETNIATSATTFVVTGQGIESINVEVLSLDGASVFSQSAGGSHLTWNQTASDGSPVANGTYLYVVTVNDANGNQLMGDVGKLVVIR
jgi:hypothetical protein